VPADISISVTPYSQMMTELLSAGLAEHGFDLREIPVEVSGYGDKMDLVSRAVAAELARIAALRRF